MNFLHKSKVDPLPKKIFFPFITFNCTTRFKAWAQLNGKISRNLAVRFFLFCPGTTRQGVSVLKIHQLESGGFFWSIIFSGALCMKTNNIGKSNFQFKISPLDDLWAIFAFFWLINGKESRVLRKSRHLAVLCCSNQNFFFLVSKFNFLPFTHAWSWI